MLCIIGVRLLILLLLLAISPGNVYGDQHHLMSCRPFDGRLSNLNLRHTPRMVLLIPLLSKDPLENESPRWAERPAGKLKAFYRARFKANVTQLHNVWNWNDYYRQIEQIEQNSGPFDRIIFIGHGGFDGPVLKSATYWQDFQQVGSKAELIRFSEAQPGLKNVLSIAYNAEKNRAFTDYMARNWQEIAELKTADIWERLKGLERRLEPLNQACYQRYCSTDKLAAGPERLRPYRVELCERTCREPLFELNTSVEISPERFLHFTQTLREAAAENGLIFFGSCNPGSKAPNNGEEKDETELLINSSLAGGPYKTYVHLVSAAIRRISAGPIGKSSADDIVDRVIRFESNRPQRNLCIAIPSAQ